MAGRLVSPSAKPYSNREPAETDPGGDTAGPKPDGATTDAKPYRETHTGGTTAGRIRTEYAPAEAGAASNALFGGGW